MPGIQFYSRRRHPAPATAPITAITDPERLCVNAAKAQLLVADALLTNAAAAGREIVANYQPAYPSKEAYFAAIDKITLDKDAVVYDDNGNATVDYQNI